MGRGSNFESLPFALFSILQKNYEHLPASVAFFAAMRYDKRYVYGHFTNHTSKIYSESNRKESIMASNTVAPSPEDSQDQLGASTVSPDGLDTTPAENPSEDSAEPKKKAPSFRRRNA